MFQNVIEEAQHEKEKKQNEERASAMEYAFQVTCIVLCYLYPTYLSLPGCLFGEFICCPKKSLNLI